MRRLALVAMCASTMVLTHSVNAAISVLKNDGSPAEPEEAEIVFIKELEAWRITLLALHNPWGETKYDIHGDGGEVIDQILIKVEGPPAGSPLFVRVFSDGPLGIQDIHGITQEGSAETLLTWVEAERDIGSITAEVIGEVQAGRDITGPIISITENNSVRGVHWLEAQRDVLGDVKAEQGRVMLVYAHRHIGTADNPVTIAAKHKINQITAGENVYADINSRVNGGSGGMYIFNGQRFVGSLNTEKLIDDSHTGSPGYVIFQQEFSGSMTFGQSLSDTDHYLELPMAGFSGQIIVNADNHDDGTLTTPIYLGPEGDPDRILLEGPHYTRSAQSMGGGSVGLVPFALHDESCVPANGEEVQSDNEIGLDEVRLRHYGPVQLGSSGPVTVKRRPVDSTGSYTTIPSAQLAFDIDSSDPNTLIVSFVSPDQGFERGFEYRITPTSDLMCAVSASPAVEWDEPYVISIVDLPCTGDLNLDGTVDINDIFLIIGYWGSVGQNNAAADLTDDGMVDINDIFAALGHWGTCQ